MDPLENQMCSQRRLFLDLARCSDFRLREGIDRQDFTVFLKVWKNDEIAFQNGVFQLHIFLYYCTSYGTRTTQGMLVVNLHLTFNRSSLSSNDVCAS